MSGLNTPTPRDVARHCHTLPWSPTLSIACVAVAWGVSEVTSPAALTGSTKDAPALPPRARTGASGGGGGRGGEEDAGLGAAAPSATCQCAHCQVLDDQMYTNGEQVERGGQAKGASQGSATQSTLFTKVTEGQKREENEKQKKKGAHTCCGGAEVCSCDSPA